MSESNQQQADQAPAADDPRLTAYALGELPASEAASVEADVAAEPRLQSVVAEIRAQGDQLRSELATRLNAPGLRPEHTEFVLATARRMSWRLEPVAQEPRPLSARLRVSEKELALFWSGVGAAAAVLVMVGWHMFRTPAGSNARGPAVVSTETPSIDESPVMNVRFLDDGRPAAAGTGAGADDPPAVARRLPQAVRGQNDGGWWPLPESGAAPLAELGQGVRPAATFPLWVDDAGFHQAREALLGRGELPGPESVRFEHWVNAVNAPTLGPVAADGPDGAAGRVVDATTPGILLAAEVAAAPWQPAHELVQIQVRLEGERLREFRRGAQVMVEPNPEVVDAFRLLGFDRTGLDMLSAEVDAESDGLAEPASYTVTALAEVRRRPDAAQGDLLRFRLEPVSSDGAGVGVPLLAVDAAPGAPGAWQEASHDFQAAAAAAELALILGGDMSADGMERLLALGRSAALDGTAARRDLARMIAAVAELGSSADGHAP